MCYSHFIHLPTGRLPFPDGTWLAKLRCHAEKAPEPVDKLRPEVPPAVAAIVEKLMAKKPVDRYPSARALIEALDAIQPGQARKPVLARFPWRKAGYVAASLAALALSVAFFATRQGTVPDPPISPAPKPSVTMDIHVRVFRPVGGDGLLNIGELGVNSVWAARKADEVVVEANFSELVYPNLLVINPNAKWELLYPKSAPVEPAKKLVHPVGSHYVTLTDVGGLAFVVLASQKPLPSLDKHAITVPQKEWQKYVLDGPWAYDGLRLEPLRKDEGKQRTGEGKHGPELLVSFCETLKALPDVVAVRSIAFAVNPQP